MAHSTKRYTAKDITVIKKAIEANPDNAENAYAAAAKELNRTPNAISLYYGKLQRKKKAAPKKAAPKKAVVATKAPKAQKNAEAAEKSFSLKLAELTIEQLTREEKKVLIVNLAQSM